MILCLDRDGQARRSIYGVPVPIAFPLGSSSALLCGVVNGLLITMLRLPPFIVTLGTWSIFGALNTLVFAQRDHPRSRTSRRSAPFLLWIGKLIKLYDLVQSIGLDLPFRKGSVVTYGSILMIVLAMSSSGTCSAAPPSAGTSTPPATIPMRRGSSGIHTNRTLIAVYALAGLICAIAALGADRPHRRGQPARQARPPTSIPSPPW